MAMAVALFVIFVISWINMSFRAFAVFNLISVGAAMVIAVRLGGDPFFMPFGLTMLIGGFLILAITSLQVHGSARGRHMLHVFIYGFFMFCRMILIMLIVTIPLAGMVRTICRSYKEICLTDGRKVWVNEDLEDAHGRRYKRIER